MDFRDMQENKSTSLNYKLNENNEKGVWIYSSPAPHTGNMSKLEEVEHGQKNTGFKMVSLISSSNNLKRCSAGS